MKHLLIALFALLACSTSAAAQTTSSRILWSMPEPLAQVTTYTFTHSIDGGAPVALAATCVTVTATTSSCSAPAPAILLSGSHKLQVTASSALGSASSPVISGVLPAKPLSVTLTITLTVP